MVHDKQDHPLILERLIHTWDVCDEYGWRSIELWQIGENNELLLRAYNKDAEEVDPNV